MKSVDEEKSFLLRHQKTTNDLNLKCRKNTIEYGFDKNVETVRRNNHDKTDIPDTEIFEVNEPRVLSTTQLSPRQANFSHDASWKPLISHYHQLGATATTTRSSPRLASASVVRNNSTLALLDISGNHSSHREHD